MDKTILAIDMSMDEPGVVLKRPGKKTMVISKKFYKKNYKGEIERYNGTINWIFNMTGVYGKDTYVIIEDYAYGAKGKTTAIAEMIGILKYRLIHEKGVLPENIFKVSIQTWKKFICNNGNAKKELIIKEIYKRYNYDVYNNNKADAFGLYKFFEAWLNNDATTKREQEAFQSFEKLNKEHKI